MNAVDTNVWIYLHDKRDAMKHERAKRLIEEVRPLALPWQVGCEFIAACRKLEPFGFSRDEAWGAFADMLAAASKILLPVPDLWIETKNLQNRYRLSFWDALLVAACIRDGVTTLFTEDLGGSPTIDGLAIVNPFTST